MSLAGYIRVSTDEQAKEGFSIDAQKRILEAYAVVKGFDGVDLYIDEGYSAKNLRRPQVQQLLNACRNQKYTTVIVWRLDRLSRSLRDTLEIFEDVFKPNGIEFISTSESIDTTTPSGRLMLNVIASFAQNEREVNEDRVRMVMTDLAQQCRHLGGVPPFGYKVVDGTYQVDENNAPAAKTIFDMYAGGKGYSEILSYLNSNGYRTARGREFGKNSLHDILCNEKYIGTYVYNRAASASRAGIRNNHLSKSNHEIVRIVGGIPALVSLSVWERTQAMMKENRRRGATHTAKSVYTLSGIVVCGVCKNKMYVNTRGRDRQGNSQRYYSCRDKCVRPVRKEKAEAMVFDAIAYHLQNEDILRQAADVANTLAQTRDNEIPGELSALEAQLDAITLRQRSLLDYIAEKGAAAPASLLDDLNRLDAEKKLLAEELNTARAASAYVNAQEIIDLLQNAMATKNRPLDEQKTAIQKAIRTVIVHDDRIDVALYNSFNGGGGGNRTPVRKSDCLGISERSLWFRFPFDSLS